LNTLTGHTAAIYSVVYSPNNQHIASASADRTIKIWDSQTGILLHTLTGHTNLICSVVYSPNGQHIASASFDKTVKIWKNPIIENRWKSRKPALLLREKSQGKIREGFNVWNIMTNVTSFLRLKK
jgi:WD40 repeat protein